MECLTNPERGHGEAGISGEVLVCPNPGQALACALYEVGGVRTCEIGSVMLGEHATMELVRLAIPRRTYTQSHIDYVVEVALEVAAGASALRGFEIATAPPALRHFTARFRPAALAPR